MLKSLICHKLSHNYLANLDIMILLSNLLIFCHVKNYQSVKYTFVMLNIHILLYTFTLLLKKTQTGLKPEHSVCL